MQSYTDEEIRSALLDLQRTKPAYGELLGLYRELFLAQNRIAAQPEPQRLALDHEAARQRLTNGFPLFSPDTFPLDPEAHEAVLRTVCDLAETAPDPLAATARAVVAALSQGELDMAALGHALLVEDEAGMARAAADMAVDAGALRFLLTTALAPLAARFARKAAAALLTDPPAWERGRCPICGHLPSLSTLADKGARILVCGFCQHQWAVPRIFCPACETRDNGRIAYFFSQEEAEYRVYTCEGCRFYLKTVDLRLLGRPFFPPAEVLLTLHLDMQAQEQGYTTHGTPGVSDGAHAPDGHPH
ncbi:MAG: formate dehydrogenase accessory protein FdhE [Desulfosarcinaceae bacterium]|nr:formate dehydrogenase accessory protein FdhE [Desulfosarcinaceae bacterium]